MTDPKPLREPTHDQYDVVIDFFPPEAMPEFVYALVKLTYDIKDGRLERSAVQPLYHDIRDPNLKPRWARGSDFWPIKLWTDVVVRGSAYGPEGRAVRSQRVVVTVGDGGKAIQVYGDRVVEWPAHGQLRFGAPEPFTKMPLDWDRAYGGWDRRVDPGFGPNPTVAELSRLEFDHPGMYPRNPFGCGYIVVDEPVDGVPLPNLEDPAQLLTPETFVTGDPRRWYRQPLPACFEFTTAMFFHRLCWLGSEAWFHPPEGAPIAEVELGVLPPDYHLLRGGLNQAPQAMQEAPIGLVFDPLDAGTPIAVEGMHPELRRIPFELPAPPRLEFHIDGKTYPVEPQLTNVLIEPDSPRVSLTYVARQFDLPRVFVPGIHAKIPIELRIEGIGTIAYVTPPTLRELRRGTAPT
ncbi:MAG TPA: DUF2169 domain-containing protein [Nannocystis sp.]|jgi:hypothetical protein